MGKTKDNRKSVPRLGPVQGASKHRPARPKASPSLGFPTISLEELARQQGVEAVQDLKELSLLWPGEFDPDDFLSWLSAERTARRQSVDETNAEPA